MALKLMSSGGGSVTLDVPSTASNLAMTVPAAAGTIPYVDSNGILQGITSGIKFPTTQVPSADGTTLDDYEEGTFTATLNMNSNPGTTNGAVSNTITSTAYYTKIGNLCNVEAYFDVTGYSNYAAFSITGLPFTARTTADGNGFPLAVGHCRGIVFRYSADIITACALQAIVSSNSTSIGLQATSFNSSYSGYYYIRNEAGQGKYIHVNGTYLTT